MRAPLCDEPCAHRPRARWRRSNDERAPGLCCRSSLAWIQCLLRAPASDPSTPRLIADVNLMPLRFLPRLLAAVLLLATVNAPAQAAIEPALAAQLGAADSDAKVDAIHKLLTAEDPRAAIILQALADDSLALIEGGKRAVVVAEGKVSDAATGAPLGATPSNLE